MTRGRNRKRRTAKGRSAATTNPQPAEPDCPAEPIRANAGEEQDPRRTPDTYQALFDALQEIAARCVFAADTGRGWDQPDRRSFLESVFANAYSLWQQNQRDDAADAFRDLLRLDRNDRQFARDGIFRGFCDAEASSPSPRPS